MSAIIDTLVAYQVVKILSTPWEETDAFELGIIDKNGKVLRKRRTLKTSKEKKAYTIVHQLAWNIKRLLSILPAGKTRLGSFAAALWLLKEETGIQGSKRFDDVLLEYVEENHPDLRTHILSEERVSDYSRQIMGLPVSDEDIEKIQTTEDLFESYAPTSYLGVGHNNNQVSAYIIDKNYQVHVEPLVNPDDMTHQDVFDKSLMDRSVAIGRVDYNKKWISIGEVGVDPLKLRKISAALKRKFGRNFDIWYFGANNRAGTLLESVLKEAQPKIQSYMSVGHGDQDVILWYIDRNNTFHQSKTLKGRTTHHLIAFPKIKDSDMKAWGRVELDGEKRITMAMQDPSDHLQVKRVANLLRRKFGREYTIYNARTKSIAEETGLNEAIDTEKIEKMITILSNEKDSEKRAKAKKTLRTMAQNPNIRRVIVKTVKKMNTDQSFVHQFLHWNDDVNADEKPQLTEAYIPRAYTEIGHTGNAGDVVAYIVNKSFEVITRPLEDPYTDGHHNLFSHTERKNAVAMGRYVKKDNTASVHRGLMHPKDQMRSPMQIKKINRAIRSKFGRTIVLWDFTDGAELAEARFSYLSVGHDEDKVATVWVIDRNFKFHSETGVNTYNAHGYVEFGHHNEKFDRIRSIASGRADHKNQVTVSVRREFDDPINRKKIMNVLKRNFGRNKNYIDSHTGNLLEDVAPTNTTTSVGGGMVGNPPGPDSNFAGSAVFRVSSSSFCGLTKGKNPKDRWKKYIEEDEIGQRISHYARKNPRRPIIIQNEADGSMVYARPPRRGQ